MEKGPAWPSAPVAGGGDPRNHVDEDDVVWTEIRMRSSAGCFGDLGREGNLVKDCL